MTVRLLPILLILPLSSAVAQTPAPSGVDGRCLAIAEESAGIATRLSAAPLPAQKPRKRGLLGLARGMAQHASVLGGFGPVGIVAAAAGQVASFAIQEKGATSVTAPAAAPDEADVRRLQALAADARAAGCPGA